VVRISLLIVNNLTGNACMVLVISWGNVVKQVPNLRAVNQLLFQPISHQKAINMLIVDERSCC
jgi:hypothetical protein